MFASLYLITAPGRMWSTDGWTRYQVPVGLVDYGWPSVPPDQHLGASWIVRGLDGKSYAYYGLGQSLAFVPLVAFGKAISQVTRNPQVDWPSFTASFINSAVATVLAVAVFALTRQIGYSPRVALGTAGLCGFGTIVWAHSRDSFDHLLETLCLTTTLALLHAASNKKTAFLFVVAGLVYGYGIMTRNSILFASPGIGLLLLLGPNQPQVERRVIHNSLLFTAGAIPGLWINLSYNAVRFGGLFITGYETKAPYWFGSPIWFGVATFLLSPGRGLLWYVPLTLFLPFLARPFYRRVSGLAISFAVIALAYLLLYSQFSGLGLWGWGPYYLLPLMPLIAVVWAEALANRASYSRPAQAVLVALIAISIAIQALSATTAWIRTYIRATVARADFGPRLDWQPEWSLLLNQPTNVANGAARMIRRTPLEFVNTTNHAYQLEHDIGLNTIDWWWVLAIYRGLVWLWIAPLLLLVTLFASFWGFFNIEQSFTSMA